VYGVDLGVKSTPPQSNKITASRSAMGKTMGEMGEMGAVETREPMGGTKGTYESGGTRDGNGSNGVQQLYKQCVRARV